MSVVMFGIRPTGEVRLYCRSCEAKESKNRYYKNRDDRLEQQKNYRDSLPADEKSRRTRRSVLAAIARRHNIRADVTKYLKSINKCAICGGKPLSKRLLDIDHDHKTGKIRGLLCRKCNLGLGLFKDNETSLQTAISYLQK